MNSLKPQYDWLVYNAEETGLGKRGENFNKLLIEDGIFYLLGSSSGNDLSKSKSIVYKSEDNGSSWTEKYTGTGNISDGYFALKELNLFKEVYSDNSLDNTSLSLINRDSVVHSFKRNSSVKGVFMDNYGKGAVVINNSFSAKDNAAFWTTDNFKTYDSIYVGKPIKKSHFFNGKVYLLTYELTRENYKVKEKNEIQIVNKGDSQSSLEVNNVEDFIVDDKGIMLLRKQEGIDIVCLSEKGQREIKNVTKKKRLDPKKIYKYDNFIAVLTSTINESALGGFGGSEYQLHLSFDGGQTFKQEKIPINDFVGTIGFYKDEKIVIYSGAGRISVCNL